MFAQTEQRSAQVAASAHLLVVVVIACVVLVAFRTEHHHNAAVIALLLADLAVSVCGIVFARTPRVGACLAWAAGLLDVGVLVGVVVETVEFQATLAGPYKPTLTGLWAVFLSLSLSALRGRPALLMVQTLLFTVGLTVVAAILAVDVHASSYVSDTLTIVFGPARSTIRVVVILVAGAMLTAITLRTRLNLSHAIVAARRAANLSRYLAPRVASFVADADVAALQEGREQNVAILFADVRAFSSMTEAMPPREIAAFLNAFRRRAVAAIESEGGVIDKFIGDEVMGLFGVPTASARDAAQALRAAQKLLRSIETWNVERTAAALTPIQVGIGVHYGPVFTGVLGDDRLEFTVLGSTVNIARRLEELTKTLAHDCIVSDEIVQAARGRAPAGCAFRGLPAQAIRGYSGSVGVSAIVTDAARPAPP